MSDQKNEPQASLPAASPAVAVSSGAETSKEAVRQAQPVEVQPSLQAEPQSIAFSESDRPTGKQAQSIPHDVGKATK